MSAPNWNELKAAGQVVYDYPGRKLAVYPSQSGQVIVLSVEDGTGNYSSVEPDEVAAVCRALLNAGGEAKVISDRIEADFAAHEAIENARGRA